MESDMTIEEIEGRVKEIREIRKEIQELDKHLQDNYVNFVTISSKESMYSYSLTEDGNRVVDKALREYRQNLFNALQDLIEELGATGFNKDRPRQDCLGVAGVTYEV